MSADAALRHYQAGEFREAGRLSQRILATDPNDLATLHLAGLTAIQSGRNEVAVGILTKAIKLNGQISDLHNALAEALQRLNRLDEAIEHYRRAVSLDPANLDAWYNCGNLLLRRGRHGEALACYAPAMAIAPDFADAIHNHGNALFGLRRLAEALVSYDRALALKPDLAVAWRNRANLLLQLNRPEDALASFERALTIRPDFAQALNDRGNALSNLGRYEEAARDFERLLAVEPDFDSTRASAFLVCRRYCCEWRDVIEPAVATLADRIAAGKRVAVPYLSLFISRSPALPATLRANLCRGQVPTVADTAVARRGLSSRPHPRRLSVGELQPPCDGLSDDRPV